MRLKVTQDQLTKGEKPSEQKVHDRNNAFVPEGRRERQAGSEDRKRWEERAREGKDVSTNVLFTGAVS